MYVYLVHSRQFLHMPICFIGVCVCYLQAAAKLGHQDQVCLLVEEAGGVYVWLWHCPRVVSYFVAQ